MILSASVSPGVAAGGLALRFQLGQMLLPVRLHLVVHPHRRGLVDADHHGLAPVAATEEVLDQIGGDGLQAVVAGDQVVFAGELPLQLLLLLLVELRLFQQALDVAVEVVVDDLQLGLRFS